MSGGFNQNKMKVRIFTIEQYKELVLRFNKMDFRNKILTIQKNSDILTLGSDYNWWVVKVKDKDIQEQLENEDNIFRIENEWDHNQMFVLIYLLGLENTDA